MVMMKVEKKKAPKPAKTECDRSVSNTLTPTFPHSTVVNMKLESFRSSSTFVALLFPEEASISSLSLVMVNSARFKPENMADWEMHNIIPVQIILFMKVTSWHHTACIN